MQMSLEQLRRRVELAIVGEADLGATLKQVDVQILAASEDAHLYRLRARLHSAAYEHVAAWQDWERVVTMAPNDLLAGLERVQLQHRYARYLAAHVLGKDFLTIAEDDGAHAAKVEQLQGQALDTLQQAMREHRADPEFILAALETWDQLYAPAPWRRYRLILGALAVNPRHARLLKAEAYFLTELAGDHDGADKAKPGFFDTISGGRYHAATTERALDALDACLESGADPDLLMAKASLLVALEYFDAAAAAFASAAQMYGSRAASASGEQQQLLAGQRDEAQAMNLRCGGGRAGYVRSHFEEVGVATARLQEMAAKSQNQPQSRTAPTELEELVAKWQSVVDTATQGPSPGERDKLAGIAKRLAKSTMSLVHLEPVELHAMSINGLEEPVSPWLLEVAPQLSKVGLKMLTWFDNPNNNRALGVQCQAQLWLDGHGASALTVETGKTAKLRRLLTTFDDGTMFVTADSRGATYTTSVVGVEGFNVDKDTPIGDMAALHLAGVARRLAARPGLRALPLDSVARLCEAENRMRLLKNAHRLRHGIGDIEIRGMNLMHHAAYAVMLKEEVAALIAQLPPQS